MGCEGDPVCYYAVVELGESRGRHDDVDVDNDDPAIKVEGLMRQKEIPTAFFVVQFISSHVKVHERGWVAGYGMVRHGMRWIIASDSFDRAPLHT